MSLNPKTWFSIFPSVRSAFFRFPLPFVFILALTIVSLFLVHKDEWFNKGALFYFYCIAGFGAGSLLVLKLFAESESWKPRRLYAVSGLVLLVVMFYSYSLFEKQAFISFFSLSLALLMALMFAPYIKRNSDENSVWFFNYQTGNAVFFAALSAIVFGGGASLVVVSVEYLFDIDISGKIFADIWIVAWALLATTYVMTNLTKIFDFEEELCEFPQGVSFIANYVLAPLMLVYMLVLYAYFIKIVLQWELPKGNIGWMVSSFGVIGVVTKLVAFPIRNKGTRLMSFFDQYFYYTLVVPVLMLFVAIFVRIDNYGITEQRYAVVLLGVWLSLVIALVLVLKKRFHIKYVPMSLAVLVFLASLGPWSAPNISFNSQFGRFESLLIKHKLIVGGQVIKPVVDLSRDVRKELSSIADYLGKNRWRSDRLRPLFKNLLLLEENVGLRDKKRIRGRQYIDMMDIEYISKWEAKRNLKTNTFNFNNNLNTDRVFVGVSGYDFIVQHYLYSYNGNEKSNEYSLDRNGVVEKIKVGVNSGDLYVRFKSGKKFVFDLDGLVLDLNKRKVKVFSKSNSSELVLEQKSSDGKTKVKLVIERLSGKLDQSKKVTITNIRYLVMLSFK